MPSRLNWVPFQLIYTQFEGGSDSICPGQIWPGIKYWSNWVEIHWNYIVCLPDRIEYHPSWFTPNLTGGQILSAPVEFDRALNTGQIGWKFTEITLYASLIKLSIIPVDLHPIWGGSNSICPGRIWPGIKYWSNWVEIHWNYIVCLPDRIEYHPSWFTPNLRGAQILSTPVKFDWALNTGQIGCKFTEITLYASLIELSIIPVDLHPIWGGGSNSIPPSRIRLGIKYWSNWVEIHWDYIVCLPDLIEYHPSRFTPNLRGGNFYPPGQIWLVEWGVKPLRLWPPNSTRHTM